MSRKKKKKQKYQQQQPEGQSLNGWSCPAVEEIDDIDDIDVIDAIEEFEESEELAELSDPAAAELLPDPAPPDPAPQRPSSGATAPPDPAPQRPSSAATAPPDPAPQRPSSAATAPPVPPELAFVYESVTPVEHLPPPPPPQAEPVETQDSQLTDYIKTMSGRVTEFLTAPRRSAEELAEDEEKFGGLDDEPGLAIAEAEEQPGKLAVLKQRVLAMRGTLQKHTQNAKTVVYSSEDDRGLLQTIRESLAELWDWAFEECYYIGVLLLRYCNDLRRMAFQVGAWVHYTIPPFVKTKRLQLVRGVDHFADACLEPFRDISNKTRSARYRIAKRGEVGEDGQSSGMVGIVMRYLYSLSRPLNKIANLLLPILGCAVLAATVLYFQQVSYALEVEYDGIKLGYVQRESDFYEAQNQMYARLLSEEYAAPEDTRPKFRLVIAEPQQVMDVDLLTNRLMSVSKHEVVNADGIYIDGAFLGAVEDGSEFLLYIDNILSNYRTGTDNERVQFVKKVTVQKGVYPQSSLRPIHEIQTAVEQGDSVPQTHTVTEGETLETVAEANNTTVAAILKLNPTLSGRAESAQTELPEVQVGEAIMVNKVELSLGIQLTRREVYEEVIKYSTDYVDDPKVVEGVNVTLSAGVDGVREITSDMTYVDGERVSETVLSREVTKEPVNARVKRGTMKPAAFITSISGGSSTSFMWPVNGGYVSAGLYGYRGHTGMDIAAPYGTGIYASADGTVSYAVNYSNGSYGKRVDISHGAGVTTRYAHCSEVLVKAGQTVQQGQLIAKVGRTGYATGNHCHFEVRINGSYMNPASYVGSRFPGYG